MTMFLLLKLLVLEREHGSVLKNVIEQYLGNVKSPDWKKEVSKN